MQIRLLPIEHIDLRHSIERRLNSNGGSCATSAQHGYLLSAHIDAIQYQIAHKSGTVGVVAQRTAILNYHSAYRAHNFCRPRNFMKIRDDGILIRCRYVIAQKAKRLHATHSRFQVLWFHVEGNKGVIVAHPLKHSIVDSRRARIRYG